MKDAYFQDELEWLLEGLIGGNLWCKLMLEAVFINIPLNVKIMSDDRNLSAKNKKLSTSKYRFSVQLQCVYSCVKNLYIKDN